MERASNTGANTLFNLSWSRSIRSGGVIRKFGLLIVLVLVLTILGFISPVFFTMNNIMNVLRQIAVNGVLAVGMTLVILSAGIDLSVGSLMAVSGVITTSMIPIHGGVAWLLLSILIGVLVTAALSAIDGVLVTRMNIAPFIATLAMMTIARGLAYIYTNGSPIIVTSNGFLALGQGSIGPVPVPVVVLAVLVAAAWFILNRTKFGRYIYAIGGNIQAAKSSGIRVSRALLWVYIINGALAGLAGLILASRISSGQPTSGGGYELDAIAAVVIGGTSLFGGSGTIMGTVLGVALIGVINNGLDLLNVSSYYQQVVKGVIIALAVILDTRAKRASR